MNIKKLTITALIAMSVLSMNSTQLKAEDMDRVADLVIKGSASLFGAMVATTALLSVDRISNDNNNRRQEQDLRINPNTGGLELNLDLNLTGTD